MAKKDVYYENFSRFILNFENSSNNDKQEIYTYSKWLKDQKTIYYVPLKVLKTTLKKQKCQIYGNKPVLIARLKTLYLQRKSATTIQRIFRGFLVRESDRLRGPAAKDLTVCTNQTDFEMMNPLCCIPKKDFFSYRDKRGFIYGFNVYSLIKILANNQGKLINPYNREDVPHQVIHSLFSVYSKMQIIYGSSHHI